MKTLKDAFNNLNKAEESIREARETIKEILGLMDEPKKAGVKTVRARRITSRLLSEEESREALLACNALCERFGQSAVARRTGIPVFTVIRIKKGTQKRVRLSQATAIKELFDKA